MTAAVVIGGRCQQTSNGECGAASTARSQGTRSDASSGGDTSTWQRAVGGSRQIMPVELQVGVGDGHW